MNNVDREVLKKDLVKHLEDLPEHVLASYASYVVRFKGKIIDCAARKTNINAETIVDKAILSRSILLPDQFYFRLGTQDRLSVIKQLLDKGIFTVEVYA